MILLTFAVAKDLSNSTRNQKHVVEYNNKVIEIDNSETHSALTSSIDSQNIDASTKKYIIKNKAVKTLQER
jgi:hypothetical protein